MMVGMKPTDKQEVEPTTEKGKTFGTVSAIAKTMHKSIMGQQLTRGKQLIKKKNTFKLGDLMA